MGPVMFIAETYNKSFIPSSISLWNDLPNNVTELPTLGSFKSALNAHYIKVPSVYYIGSRYVQILHSRLRLGNSDLNGHRYLRHIQSDPTCSCGHFHEDPYHFILVCPLFSSLREKEYFFRSNIDISITLHGVPDDYAETEKIFSSFHNYLTKSNRFQNTK